MIDEGHQSYGVTAEIAARLNEKAFYHLDAPVCRMGQIDAACDSGPLASLLEQFRTDAGIELSAAALFARFAAQAWRSGTATDDRIVLAVQLLASDGFGPQTHYVDPDRTRLTTGPVDTDAAPDLLLRDLTGSRLTGLTLAVHPATPVLTVAREHATSVFRLGFAYGTGQLDDDAAIAIMIHFADALADPLVHLA